MKKEIKVYVICVDNLKDGEEWWNFSNEQFMDKAEKEGRVYTLQGFESAFNGEAISEVSHIIRIIKN